MEIEPDEMVELISEEYTAFVVAPQLIIVTQEKGPNEIIPLKKLEGEKGDE